MIIVVIGGWLVDGDAVNESAAEALESTACDVNRSEDDGGGQIWRRAGRDVRDRKVTQGTAGEGQLDGGGSNR